MLIHDNGFNMDELCSYIALSRSLGGGGGAKGRLELFRKFIRFGGGMLPLTCSTLHSVQFLFIEHSGSGGLNNNIPIFKQCSQNVQNIQTTQKLYRMFTEHLYLYTMFTENIEHKTTTFIHELCLCLCVCVYLVHMIKLLPIMVLKSTKYGIKWIETGRMVQECLPWPALTDHQNSLCGRWGLVKGTQQTTSWSRVETFKYLKWFRYFWKWEAK